MRNLMLFLASPYVWFPDRCSSADVGADATPALTQETPRPGGSLRPQSPGAETILENFSPGYFTSISNKFQGSV